ncbi:MAG: acetamidase/formamidase family protein [Anaerolineae bacterium]|nr:acetamidase/formamidase family protein [Anaerolineae bacterium]
MSTIHHLDPSRQTLHGHFSPDLAPVLTIDPGDTVHFRTLDANWGLESYIAGKGIERAEFAGRVSPEDDGHALTGPVAIRGAKPGMTLEVHIGAIIPGASGACLTGGWPSAMNERLGIVHDPVIHVYDLNAETMTGRNQHGHTVTLRPFMGVMGVAPDTPGPHSTIPPRRWGGNMDCKELVTGSTLYLPIGVEGALFSTGDGHAAQGDGESGGTAIECPMERVELTFHLRDDFPLTTPIAKTPAGWLTMGFHEDLDEAAMIALEAMFALMGRQYGIGRVDAIALTSVVVDLHVTQIVNGVKGVHALLPFGALR